MVPQFSEAAEVNSRCHQAALDAFLFTPFAQRNRIEFGIRCHLFVEVRGEKAHDVVMPELLGPRDQRAIPIS